MNLFYGGRHVNGFGVYPHDYKVSKFAIINRVVTITKILRGDASTVRKWNPVLRMELGLPKTL
jgi:hypothetical protein